MLVRYAMRNALAPSVQVLALNLQWLIGGIIITETVFAYPGIGSKLVTAVGSRDVTLVQSVAMLIAAVYVLVNLVADFDRAAARAEAAESVSAVADRSPFPLRAGARRRLRFRRRRSARSRRRLRRAARGRLTWSTSRRTIRPRRSAFRSAGPRRRWLGTDYLGRDVFSRLLYGGRSVMLWRWRRRCWPT